MSLIYSIVCIFFLTSTISSTVQRPAPQVVYSAVIHNEQGAPTDCYVVWKKPLGENLQSEIFTIGNQDKYVVDENLVNIDSYQARSVIEEIHCGKLALIAPFDGVQSPKLKWNFFVETDKIVSGRSY